MVAIRKDMIFNLLKGKNIKQNRHSEGTKLPSTTMISQSEQNILLKSVHVPHNTDRNIRGDSLINYLSPISDAVARRGHDSDYIKALAPEVEQAAAIFIPSILSPNDLQEDSLSYNLDNVNLSPEQCKDVLNIVREHFNFLDINNKLSEWLNEAIYGSGSKPVMILPEVFLKTLIEQSVVSNESFGSIEQYFLDDNIYTDEVISMESCISGASDIIDVTVGMESIMNDMPEQPKNKKDVDKFIISVEQSIVKSINSNELVNIHQNPSVVGLSSLKKEYTKKKLTKSIEDGLLPTLSDVKYKHDTVVSFGDIGYNEDDQYGNPLMLELPSESVIPIITPGSPHDHIGYFVLIDENGNPVDIEASDDKDVPISSLKNSFNAMFGNCGNLLGINNKSSSGKQQLVNHIYENMLNRYILKTLKTMNMDNVDISKNPSIYKCMFRRLLEHKKTRIVFVPTDLLIYYRFNHHKDGTGKSKIEDIKFVLSLRITLMVSRILTSMDNAVQRQKVSIKFSDKDANILSTAKAIRNSIVEEKLTNFTYNPESVVKSITERGISVVPEQIPGLERFDVSLEDTNKNRPVPDTDLMDDTGKMLVNGLGPPAAAMNNLSDAEYSRSVATTNLFFSKQIKGYQAKTCTLTTDLVRAYIKFSKPLRQAITDIIKSDSTDDGSVDIDTLNETELHNIIDNISVSLPAPNIAPDKAGFENFESFHDIIDKLVDNIYSTDLVDRDSEEDLNKLKAFMKNRMTRQYLVNSGFNNVIDVPDITDIDTGDLIDIYRTISNTKKRIEKMNELHKGKSDEDSGGGSSW